MKNKFILLIIIILGFGLRFYKLSENPPGLNTKEVFIGYNAYSIIRTASDERGNFLPFLFNFNNQKILPGYIYLTSIPIWLFGPTAISVRIISLLSGLALILIGYLITKQITNHKKASLFAAFLVAVSPWGLFMSRIGLPTSLNGLLISLGIYVWIKKENWLSFVFWGMGLYTSIVSWYFVPLIVLYPLIYLIKRKRWKDLIIGLSISLVFLVPVIYQLIDTASVDTFFNLLSQPINLILVNYLKNFDLITIFFNRGDFYQFSLPGQGLLFLTTAPFIMVGIFFLIKQTNWLLIIWLLASFIPASLMFKEVNFASSLIILPLPMVLTGLGLSKAIKYFHKKSRFGGNLILLVLTITIFAELGLWWRDYWDVYQDNYSWVWQFGSQQAIDYVNENYSKYDLVLFTKKYGLTKQHLLFYWPWEPTYIQAESEDSSDGFDKFEFHEDWEISEKAHQLQNSNKNILLITSPNNYPEGGDVIETINFLDGEPAFQLVNYGLISQ